jgi:uncharacterized protein YqjF (DUF2071 family)
LHRVTPFAALILFECREFDSRAPSEGYIDTHEPVETRPSIFLSILMSRPLDRTAHRPWPLPSGPWIMAQSWHHLLFAHWPIDPALLRPQIPAALQIDTFNRQAWIAVVPFRMSGVRLRATPALPWLSAFPELNVRTYVVADEKPGVWFFSLDAQNPIAVAAARAWFHLPYFRARMKCEDRDGRIHYRSERTHPGAPPAALQVNYRPVAGRFEPKSGTLEHFLTERYCLYAADSHNRISRGEIHHQLWQLQIAEATFQQNSMTEAANIPLPSQRPLLHFARRQDMVAWNPQNL